MSGGIFSHKEFSKRGNIVKKALVPPTSFKYDSTIDSLIWQHAFEEFDCGGHESRPQDKRFAGWG
jgi:hypothetical protein